MALPVDSATHRERSDGAENCGDNNLTISTKESLIHRVGWVMRWSGLFPPNVYSGSITELAEEVYNVIISTMIDRKINDDQVAQRRDALLQRPLSDSPQCKEIPTKESDRQLGQAIEWFLDRKAGPLGLDDSELHRIVDTQSLQKWRSRCG